jgi:rod shape-determining protein MreD
MNRNFLRFLNAPGFVLMVALAVALQTTLFSTSTLRWIKPDFVLLSVFWVALRRSFTEGGILTLIFGRITELHSGSPQGVLSLCYLAVFLVTRLLIRIIVLPRISSLVLASVVLMAFWHGLHLSILHLFGLASHHWRHVFFQALPSMLVIAVVARPVFQVFDRFDFFTQRGPRSRIVLEDELLLEGGGY